MPRPIPQILWAVGSLFLKTPTEGAETSVYCCTANVEPGAYYADCQRVKREARWALSKRAISDIWDTTERMLNEHAPETAPFLMQKSPGTPRR